MYVQDGETDTMNTILFPLIVWYISNVLSIGVPPILKTTLIQIAFLNMVKINYLEAPGVGVTKNKPKQKGYLFTIERQTVEAEICKFVTFYFKKLQIVLGAANYTLHYTLLMRCKRIECGVGRIARKLEEKSRKMKVTEAVHSLSPICI